MAIMHQEGKTEELKNDYSKALFYYKKAVENGYMDSYTSIGFMYYNGNGVEKNYQKAFMNFKKAADHDVAFGCYTTGLCYEEGIGTDIDKSKALKYFKQADKLGYTEAKEKLKKYDQS